MKSAFSRFILPLLAVAVLVAATGRSFAAAGALTVTDLRCEYLANPLGIDAPQPRLSWIVDSKQRSQVQSAFQIIVSTNEAQLKSSVGELWDTGRIAADQTLLIAYGGRPLTSGQRAWWKVKVWDAAGNESVSEPAFWEMGLLTPQDWPAQWIARTSDTNSRPAPYLRRTFNLTAKIKRARAYICGLGYYELHINGKIVGDRLLDPAYTRFDKRVFYSTYDVTEDLRRGKNAMGVILGNGWYNVQTLAVWGFDHAPWRSVPKLLMELRVEYADGYVETFVTDNQWKTSSGPIMFDSIYGGETYEARLEQPDWDKAEFDDSTWAPAKVVAPPGGRLVAEMIPPIKAFEVLKPVKIMEPAPGVFVFDFGQNLAGYADLTVHGAAGTSVVMKYGERLATNGLLDRAEIQQHVVKLDTNQLFQTDTYVLKGEGKESWHPRFVYHGFQYIEMTGFPGKPSAENLQAVFVHSAVPVAGEFECSNPLLNKIWRAARWSYLSNLQGIPTDCPHREKNGWTGDAHLAAEQGLLNFAPQTVYAKWIDDLGDEQRPSGELPGIVPTSGWGYKWGNGPAWDSAFLLIPFYLYQYCGDTKPLRDHYDGMKRYVDYLTSGTKDGIVDIGLNDWAPYDTKTPADITSTAYYYRDARIVAMAANMVGNQSDALGYLELAASIKGAFLKKFYQPETGSYGNGSQTSLSCALYQGLVDPENKARVVSNLVANIEARNGHIDTGILGAKYVLNVLLENGRADVAYRVASQKDLPGWGWWIEQGATTLWEEWNGSGSRNHIMFGDISAWFYKALAGINPDPASPGFKHFIIKPNVLGDLTYARASYNSVRGRIASEWSIDKDAFRLKVIIPANTTATVFMPNADPGKVMEGKNPAGKTDGVKFLRAENGAAVYEVASGAYEFVAPRAPSRNP